MARRKLKRKFQGSLDEETKFYARLDAKHMVEDSLSHSYKTKYNRDFNGNDPVYRETMIEWLDYYFNKSTGLTAIVQKYNRNNKNGTNV